MAGMVGRSQVVQPFAVPVCLLFGQASGCEICMCGCFATGQVGCAGCLMPQQLQCSASLPACPPPPPGRFRECISDQHYIPSLLAMYGLDNEASSCCCSRVQCLFHSVVAWRRWDQCRRFPTLHPTKHATNHPPLPLRPADELRSQWRHLRTLGARPGPGRHSHRPGGAGGGGGAGRPLPAVPARARHCG